MEQAKRYYEDVIEQDSSHFGTFVNLGLTYEGMQLLEPALVCYKRAYGIDTASYEVINNIGNVLYQLHHLDEAIGFFDRAIALSPEKKEAYWNKSLALLKKGDFKNGWPMYETRWELASMLMNIKIPFKQPRWQGQSLKGKTILLVGEQGLGDTLQFCRYAPMVAALSGRVIIICQPGLKEVLSTLKCVDDVLTEVTHLTQFDYYCPLMSLPGILQTELNTIPCEVPYLATDPKLVDAWKNRLQSDQQFKVGLVWSGNPRRHDLKSHLVDRRRSLALYSLAPLLDIKNISFYSLQKGEGAQHLAASPFKNRVIDHTNLLNNFADTAAFIQQLDLVITVDTSVAHLTGALAKPVWVLSRFDGCWRWLMNRTDSPWYPTLRLFNQPQLGAWEPVIDEVKTALQRLVVSKH